MNQKNIILFAICAGSLGVLWYSYGVSHMSYVNWIVSLCYWSLIFSSFTLFARLLFRPDTKFYLITASVAAGILLCEFALRMMGIGALYLEKRNGFYVSPFQPQETHWFHVWTPNAHHDLTNIEYNYPRSSNSLGLSDDEFNKEKRPNTVRIIGIGDSFTEGDGSPADSTWLKRLKQNLSKKYPDIHFDTYNPGVCGSDPFFGYKLLKEKLMAYQPDLVVMTINNSDIDDYMVRGGMERFRADSTTQYRPHPWYEFPFAISYINRLILNASLHLDHNLMEVSVRDQRLTHARSDIAETIKEANMLCKKNEARMLVLIHPLKGEYDQKKYWTLAPLVDSLQTDKDLTVFDHLQYMENDSNINTTNIGQYYWVIDGHHNSKGYMLMGDAITPIMISLLQPQLDSLQSLAQLDK